MSTFKTVKGFQDALAAPHARRAKQERPVLKSGGRGGQKGGANAVTASAQDKARLARVAAKAPEVMVKITGRTKDAGHLRAHLEYISRNGEIPLETRDGVYVPGREGVHDLADDWKADVESDPRHRANSPYSINVILSMPPGTHPRKLTEAVRDFASETFGARHDYVFAYHNDTKHPHVHLTIRPVGDDQQRLNPRKADLEQWRQTFAQKLRDRGVEAEATPRRARGQTLKGERLPVRKLKERGVPSTVLRQARIDAGAAAFGRDTELRPWEKASRGRQKDIRTTYLTEARALAASSVAADRELGEKVERFVRDMPQPDSLRLSLARELKAAHDRLQQAQRAGQEGRGQLGGPDQQNAPNPGKGRGR